MEDVLLYETVDEETGGGVPGHCDGGGGSVIKPESLELRGDYKKRKY